jgi:hypothetical protein
VVCKYDVSIASRRSPCLYNELGDWRRDDTNRRDWKRATMGEARRNVCDVLGDPVEYSSSMGSDVSRCEKRGTCFYVHALR